MLLNPKRRRRRSRRNPIGQFVPASGATRRRRRKTRRTRRTRRTVARRTRRTRRVVAVRRTRRTRRVVAVRHRRRRKSSFGRLFRRHASRYGSKTISLKTLTSKEMLLMGAGAIVGGIITPAILTRLGASLPGMTNKWGQAAYAVAVPLGLAMFVQRVNKPIAQGLALSAIVTGLNVIFQPVLTQVQNQLAPATAAAGAYLDTQPVAALPSYQATNQFGASVLQSSSAFNDEPWQ